MSVENKVSCLSSVYKGIGEARKILDRLAEITNKRFSGEVLPLEEIVSLSSQLDECKTDIEIKLIESEQVDSRG
ncbi:hypothetical protein MAF45_10625 [Mesosutterella sp. OilRF-GAM-744-9]|uniref:Uncharacterized protein n=1 Tax=Mesosutterella porci TaxID=2915351 RepID=A0ABS9MTG5_9BURK|nr:hypothetical protein [Mesosutterella sp. oilRF-744-WT-GAM-9]MCG5031889.1 hypothetical protein [Mesosutterella sp. oilRF-744-WT-GAM-9]